MLRTCLAVVAVACCAGAQAGFDSGNRLYEDCASGNYFNRGYCGGYIVGIVDTIEAMQASGVLPQKSLCIPPDSTKGQLADVVRNYLADHPEQRHLDAASLVPQALNTAFGCGS